MKHRQTQQSTQIIAALFALSLIAQPQANANVQHGIEVKEEHEDQKYKQQNLAARGKKAETNNYTQQPAGFFSNSHKNIKNTNAQHKPTRGYSFSHR